MLQTWQVFMDSYRSRILMLINETKKKKKLKDKTK